MANAIWLADVLRDAGCKVVEIDGWKTRGRASMGEVKGIICHHTGPTSSTTAAVDLIERGRADLPGPLSQMVLDVDGTFYVVAAGRCNHAGKGKWHDVVNGNSEMLGIEARNRGDGSAWPDAEVEAYFHGCAAIARHAGFGADMVCGHKEYALPHGRKVDPTLDMIGFRQHVSNILAIGATQPLAVLPVPHVDPVHDMLKKGDMGGDVKLLQRTLGLVVDGHFGPKTEDAVKQFQASKGLVADGKVGPKTWVALGI